VKFSVLGMGVLMPLKITGDHSIPTYFPLYPFAYCRLFVISFLCHSLSIKRRSGYTLLVYYRMICIHGRWCPDKKPERKPEMKLQRQPQRKPVDEAECLTEKGPEPYSPWASRAGFPGADTVKRSLYCLYKPYIPP